MAGRTNLTERSGVNKVATIVNEDLKWIFREQFVGDVGVDAIIEQVIEDNPTGKLMAVQIKSGVSYLKHQDDHHIYFRIDASHYDYWTELCIPVIIAIYDPDISKVYWGLFSENELRTTGNSYVLSIKKSSILDSSSLELLNEIIDYHLKATLLDDVENDELDYNHLMEMCTLYTEEATGIIDELNKYGYDLADRIMGIVGSVRQYSNPSQIFTKIKTHYNIYATKIKKNLPVLFKLRVNSLKYIELCMPLYGKPEYSLLTSYLVEFFNALAASVSIINKMISDIKIGLEVHKNDPTKYPPEVQRSIKNKIHAEEEYIIVLESFNRLTLNILTALPENIKKDLQVSDIA